MEYAPQTDVGSGEEASWINDQATRIRRVTFDPVAVVEIATAIGPTSSPFVRLRRMHAQPGHNSRAYSAASHRDIRYSHDCMHNPTRHAGHSFLRRAEVCCRGQESRAGQARKSSALEAFEWLFGPKAGTWLSHKSQSCWSSTVALNLERQNGHGHFFTLALRHSVHLRLHVRAVVSSKYNRREVLYEPSGALLRQHLLIAQACYLTPLWSAAGAKCRSSKAPCSDGLHMRRLPSKDTLQLQARLDSKRSSTLTLSADRSSRTVLHTSLLTRICKKRASTGISLLGRVALAPLRRS